MKDGCHLHKNCFTCPFSDCRLGMRLSGSTYKRKLIAMDLQRKGFSAHEIAVKLETSERNIQRDLRR